MKPNPFESLNHFTVPSDIFHYSFLCGSFREPFNIVELKSTCSVFCINKKTAHPFGCAANFSYFVNYNNVLHLLLELITDFFWKCKYFYKDIHSEKPFNRGCEQYPVQARCSCAREACAFPPLISGMMLNSRTVTMRRSTP